MHEVCQTAPFRKWLRLTTIRGERLVLLLAGGDKSSQERDIVLARSMIEILEKDA